MFIHRKNVLKAHQHSSIQREHLKKHFNTKSHQNIHQDAPNCIFSKFSLGVACPLACVQLISLFLYEKNYFSFRMHKIYTKTHQL